MILNFFEKKVLNSPNLKIEIAFHYHLSSSNALVLYNLSLKSIYDIAIEVLNTDQKKFHADLNHISPKIGELIKLNDLVNDAGLPFEGSVDQVYVTIRGRVYKFIRHENKFIKV